MMVVRCWWKMGENGGDRVEVLVMDGRGCWESNLLSDGV